MGRCVRLIVAEATPAELAPTVRLIVCRYGPGVTTQEATGWWGEGLAFTREEDSCVRSEPVTILECSVGTYEPQWWNELAQSVRTAFKQDCVFLSVHTETAMLVYEKHSEPIHG